MLSAVPAPSGSVLTFPGSNLQRRGETVGDLVDVRGDADHFETLGETLGCLVSVETCRNNLLIRCRCETDDKWSERMTTYRRWRPSSRLSWKQRGPWLWQLHAPHCRIRRPSIQPDRMGQSRQDPTKLDPQRRQVGEKKDARRQHQRLLPRFPRFP